MRYKKRFRKPNKYCKLFGIEIEYEKSLNDAEVRLFHFYLRTVDWEIRHVDYFGTSELTVRDIHELYLPNWSTGKINNTQRSLIKKGWLHRTYYGRIEIINYEMYRESSVQLAEQEIHQTRRGVQLLKKDVQSPKLDVQQDENPFAKWKEDLKQKGKDLMGENEFPVQSNEPWHRPKET